MKKKYQKPTSRTIHFRGPIVLTLAGSNTVNGYGNDPNVQIGDADDLP